MRPRHDSELTVLVGGEYSKVECASLGFATGATCVLGGPIGWFGAAFCVWQAYDGGCFR